MKMAGALPVAGALGGCGSIPDLRYTDMPIDVHARGKPFEFDKSRITANLRIASLPDLYEYCTVIAGNQSHDEALNTLHARCTGNTELSVLRHGNTTAVVAYEPELHKVTVAYDGTQERGDVWDHVKGMVSSAHAPSGGNVHTGYRDAIYSTDGETGKRLCDAVRDIVASYAQKAGNIDLTLTGFSRGGGLAVATAAEWFESGMPGGDKTRLTNVETFAPVPYGDRKFVKWFEGEARKKGTHIMRVVAGNDITPELSSWKWLGVMGPSKYRQAGDVMHLFPPSDNSGITEVMVNPTSRELYDRASQFEAPVNWHGINTMAKLLGAKELYVEWDDVRDKTAVGPHAASVVSMRRAQPDGFEKF